MSDDEFFRLTPRRYRLLIDRQHEFREHQELLSGIVAAEIRNAVYSFASEPPKPAVPADFMPSQWVKQKPKATRINRRRIVDKVRGFLMGQVQGKP